jgi:hypothetical protein
MKIPQDLDTSLHRLKVLNNLGTLLRGHPVATTAQLQGVLHYPT